MAGLTRAPETEVIIKDNDEVVHITDIDADITKEEIVEEISKTTKSNNREDMKLQHLRPNRNGNNTATVILRKQVATELINKGTVKIGWTACRIRKRVNIIRCYKCLQFGYTKANSEGLDRSGDCIKCGKQGHKAKECPNQAFCTVCETKGHRADQTRWPRFKKLIREKERKMTLGGDDKLKTKEHRKGSIYENEVLTITD